MAAGLVWCAVLGHARWKAVAALVFLLACGYALRSIEWTAPAGDPLRVALVQGNVPQEPEVRPGALRRTLDTYARLAEEADAAARHG